MTSRKAATGGGRARPHLPTTPAITAALGGLSDIHDPEFRRRLVTYLRREIGDDFRFQISLSKSTRDDIERIVESVIRADGVEVLVDAVRLLSSSAVLADRFATIVDEAHPDPVLTWSERAALAEAMSSLPPAELETVIAAAGLPDVAVLDPSELILAWETNAIELDGHEPSQALLRFVALVSRTATVGKDEVESLLPRVAERLGIDPSTVLGDPSALLPERPHVARTTEMAIPAGIAPIPEIVGGLPPRNPDFVGREEAIQRLSETLQQHRQASVLPTAVHGLGGVGKSQLVGEFARRKQGSYQLIWWIPSADARSIRRSLVSLARRLDLAVSTDVQVTVDTLLDRLRVGKPFAKWLLVFDDAADPATVQPYLPSGPGHVLISSRNSSWRRSASALELDVFSERESIDYLDRRWPGLSRAAAARLANRLGYLPLALEQAASLHAESGMPLEQYLEQLDAQPALTLREGRAHQYPKSATETWQLSFQQLQERSPGAAQLLQLCAFLSANPISIPMLSRGRGAALPAELAHVMRNDMEMRKAVRELVNLSLAKLDSRRDLLTVHMLVSEVIRDSMNSDDRAAMRRSAQAVLALANPGRPDNPTTWRQHAEVAPHVKESEAINSDDAEVRRIILDQIRYLFVMGDYAESKALAELAVTSWDRGTPDGDPLTLEAAFHLGNALRASGEYAQARQINTTTLARMKEVLGDDHEHTLRTANSCGADLRLLGQFRQAREIDEPNLARCRSTLGENDPITLRVANNLAIDHRLLGDFRRAMELDEETLRRRQDTLDELHPEVLWSFTAMARDRAGIGEYSEALQLSTELLDRFAVHLAGHPAMLAADRNHVILLRFNGHPQEAVVKAVALERACRARFRSGHEYLLAAQVTLANALRACGRPAEALAHAEEALDAYTTNFGAEHPFTLACATDLGVIYRGLGRIDDAYTLDSATVDALRRTLGAQHLYTLISTLNLSSDHALRNEYAEAFSLSEAVLNISRQVRAPDHPYTFACAVNVALDLESLDRHSEAAQLRAETLERMRRQLGPEHPDTVNAERGRRAESVIEVPPT